MKSTEYNTGTLVTQIPNTHSLLLSELLATVLFGRVAVISRPSLAFANAFALYMYKRKLAIATCSRSSYRYVATYVVAS